ncbi:hypothetical protein SFRURICE_002766, partial [Spodoptera frugiperda]
MMRTSLEVISGCSSLPGKTGVFHLLQNPLAFFLTEAGDPFSMKLLKNNYAVIRPTRSGSKTMQSMWLMVQHVAYGTACGLWYSMWLSPHHNIT